MYVFFVIRIFYRGMMAFICRCFWKSFGVGAVGFVFRVRVFLLNELVWFLWILGFGVKNIV